MATWNSRQPLRLTHFREKTVKKDGRNEVVKAFDRHVQITLGDPLPDELLTVSFIGESLDQLANLSQADKAKLEEWERRNPTRAHKWDHLKLSAQRWRTLFPDDPNIVTVGAVRGG